MADNIESPFADDHKIPEISPSGLDGPEPPGLGLEPDFGLALPAPTRSIPWALIGGVVGGVLLLALIVVGASKLIPLLGNPPDRVVRSYYQALEAGDLNDLARYIDPDATVTGNALPAMESFKQQIDRLLGGQGENKLALQFLDLQYAKVAEKGAAAKVQVKGRVRFYLKGSSLGLTLPYNWTHDLVKKNGHWYLKAW